MLLSSALALVPTAAPVDARGAAAPGEAPRLVHAVTPLGPTGRDDWSFAAQDVDGEGYDELVALARSGGSGRTEVHALGDGGRRWVLHAATPLAPTRGEAAWSLDLA